MKQKDFWKTAEQKNQIMQRYVILLILLVQIQNVISFNLSFQCAKWKKDISQTESKIHHNQIICPISSPKKQSRTSLSVLPQQLGEFESLSFINDEQNNANHRQVKLYNYISNANDKEKWIPYEMGWEFQKKLLNAHLDRIKSDNDLQKVQNEIIGIDHDDPFIKSTQFLSSMESNDLSFMKNESFQGDSIIMLQHNPVYTLGTASDPSFIKDQNGSQQNNVDIVRIDRGGEGV